jgi:hypothetical protein
VVLTRGLRTTQSNHFEVDVFVYLGLILLTQKAREKLIKLNKSRIPSIFPIDFISIKKEREGLPN